MISPRFFLLFFASGPISILDTKSDTEGAIRDGFFTFRDIRYLPSTLAGLSAYFILFPACLRANIYASRILQGILAHAAYAIPYLKSHIRHQTNPLGKARIWVYHIVNLGGCRGHTVRKRAPFLLNSLKKTMAYL